MSDVILSVLLNILASVLYFALGAGSLFFLAKLRTWSKTRLVSQIYNDKTLVVALTTRDGPLPRSTARVSLTEVEAVVNLKSLVGEKIHIELMKHPPETALLSNKNVLCLGGTLANTVTAQALEILKNKFPFIFQIDAPRKIVIADRSYEPVYSQDGSVVLRDYAVIVKTENPFSETAVKNKKIFIIMGLHGYGTRGAVIALMDSKISKEIWRKVKTGDFSAVIRIEIDRNQRLNVFLEEVWGM